MWLYLRIDELPSLVQILSVSLEKASEGDAWEMTESIYKVPCHGCMEHSARCHIDCPRYKEWAALNEELKAAKKRDRENRTAIISPAYESIQLNRYRKMKEHRK